MDHAARVAAGSSRAARQRHEAGRLPERARRLRPKRARTGHGPLYGSDKLAAEPETEPGAMHARS